MSTYKAISIEELNITKNQPILDIAASIWEAEKYNAFKTCYRAMRSLDDLVDDRKSILIRINDRERNYYSTVIANWKKAIIDKDPIDFNQKELLETIAKYHIPFWPWIEFSNSMIHDINFTGFQSLKEFIKYSEGAAISPGSIFMHLCGIKDSNGYLIPPMFDVKKAARPLALFSYFVHVIRDFQKDQISNLNYIPDKLIYEHGLSHNTLKKIATGGKVVPEFRELMKSYYKIIEYYRHKARNMLDTIKCFLESRYMISLEIIYNLYLQIFEKIDTQDGRFTSEELNPTFEEVQSRLNLILSEYQSVEY